MTGFETRVCVPGHMQRGGSPSPYDRVLATQFGAYAAKLVEHEHYGVTVAMKNNHVTENPLAEAAGKSRLVPDGHGMLEVARRMGGVDGVSPVDKLRLCTYNKTIKCAEKEGAPQCRLKREPGAGESPAKGAARCRF